MRICYFARVEEPQILRTVGFYSQDIDILTGLGHDVVVAHRIGSVPFDCDLYFVHWWTYALEPVLKARIRRKPIIIVGAFNPAPVQLPGSSMGYGLRPWWQKLLISTGARLATANVLPSEIEREEVAELLNLSNTFYIPWVVNSEKYAFVDGPRERFVLNVAWSGAVNGRRKCLLEIVEAFAIVKTRVPDARLVMAGRQGELHSELVDMVNHFGIDDAVEFLGVISEEEKIDLMQRCSVYLQPTLYEGFGLAMAEAMSCGAALVTSPAGAVPELVADTAILVDGSVPEDIANATAKLLLDRPWAEEIARMARIRIETHFTVERRSEAISKLLREIS